MIAWIGDHAASSRDEIWVVDLRGPTPSTPVSVRGNWPVSADTNGGFQWTPDSRAIVFNADFDASSIVELWWVDVSTPPPYNALQISGTLVANGDVAISYTQGVDEHWAVSPGGMSVFYIADGTRDNAFGIYYVDLSGTLPTAGVQWSNTTSSGLNADDARWSPDGTKLLVYGDLASSSAEELFLLNTTDPMPQELVKVSGTPGNTSLEVGTDFLRDYGFSPDSSKVFYIADQVVNGMDQLFMVGISGAGRGPPMLVSPVPPGNSTAMDVNSFRVSPDSSKVAFHGDLTISGGDWIYVADVSNASAPGAANLIFAQPPNGNQDTFLDEYAWTADGTSIVFRGDVGATDNAFNVFKSDVSGTAPYTAVQVGPTLPSNGDIHRFVRQP